MMLNFSFFKSSPNDRADSIGLSQQANQTEQGETKWFSRSGSILNRINPLPWVEQSDIPGVCSDLIRPLKGAPDIAHEHRVFNNGKFPSFSKVSTDGDFHGVINQFTKNPQFYLGDDWTIPRLLGRPEEGEFDLAVASHNVLDPTAAWWDNNSLAGKTESRIDGLAKCYERSGLGIVATQESSKVHQTAFKKAGFSVINPDKIKEAGDIPVNRVDTRKRAAEQKSIREKGLVERYLHAIKSWKYEWSGLNVFYDAEKYTPHPNHTAEFRVFSDVNQKGWSAITDELPSFIKLGVQSLLSRWSPNDDFSRQFTATRNAFSGVARKDGILVAHLTDKKTGKHVIVCDTHWESFDIQMRGAQSEEYIAEINQLREQYPAATVVLAGDFNRPQVAAVREGVAYDDMVGHFKKTMNAHSMPLVQLTETYPGQTHLDGTYVIPAKDEEVIQTQGRTLKPYSLYGQLNEQYEHYSDHSAVVLNARLGPKAPARDVAHVADVEQHHSAPGLWSRGVSLFNSLLWTTGREA